MLVIPRIFHRIWLGRAPMPAEFVEFGQSWLAHHPGWEMRTWTDDNLPPLANAEALRLSPALSGKANILRYEILLRFGGVYIDTDFECLRNLEPILDGVECFTAWQSPKFANNAIMGCVPGHPFLQDLVDNLAGPGKDFTAASIRQSGPYYLTERLSHHPEVTVFRSAWFYPYEWHERWRRHEEFPNAYGVHHWTLSWRTPRALPAGTVREFAEPKVSVVVLCSGHDAGRLRWVLEGLCCQTADAFEVWFVDRWSRSAVRDMVQGSRNRIDARYYAAGREAERFSAKFVRFCMRRCRAPRIVFLLGDCVPDPDLVGTHAEFADLGLVPFGFQRLYPGEKLFPFIPPLDYDALRKHSQPDVRRSHPFRPFTGDWRDVSPCGMSVPRAALQDLPAESPLPGEHGLVWLARSLSQEKYRLLPLFNEAHVTRLCTAGESLEVPEAAPDMALGMPESDGYPA